MSINMTSAFSFETDDLKSLAKMLGVAVDVLFHNNGRYTKLHIKTVAHGGWRDGKEWGCYWDQQSKVVSLPSGSFLPVKPQEMYGGVNFLGPAGDETRDKDAVAEAMCHARTEEPRATRVFIAMLGDYSNDYNKKNGDIYCMGKLHMVEKAMEIAAAFDLGTVVCNVAPPFPNFDGSVGAGYRLHMEYSGGSEVLVMSAVLALYGK